MQFVLMIYQGTTPYPGTPEWESLSPDAQKAVYADYAALNQLENVTPGPALGLPESATTVRVNDDGTTTTTEGPYPGAREAVGGFMIVDAEDLEAALAIASRVPAARLGGAVEVRPCATYW